MRGRAVENSDYGFWGPSCMDKEMVNIIKTTYPDKDEVSSDEIKVEVAYVNLSWREARDKMCKIEDEHLVEDEKTIMFGPSGFLYKKDGNVIRYDMQVPTLHRPDRWMVENAKDKKNDAVFKKRLKELSESANENTSNLLETIFSIYQDRYNKKQSRRKPDEFSIYGRDEMKVLLKEAKQKGKPVEIKGYLDFTIKDGKPAFTLSSYDDDDKGKSYIIKNKFYKDTCYKLAQLLMEGKL